VPNIGPVITTKGYQCMNVPYGSYYIVAQANCTAGGTTAWGPAYYGGLQTTSIRSQMKQASVETNGTNGLPQNAKGIAIFPNPSSSQINLTYNAEQNGKAEIMVSDALGSTLIHKTMGITAGQNSFQMPIAQLRNGIYLVKFMDGVNVYVQKLIVQK
jgi:hypothetical protein